MSHDDEVRKVLLSGKYIALTGMLLVRQVGGVEQQVQIKPVKPGLIDLTDDPIGSCEVEFKHELLTGFFKISVNKLSGWVSTDLSRLVITDLAKLYGYGEMVAPMLNATHWNSSRRRQYDEPVEVCDDMSRNLKREPFVRDRYGRIGHFKGGKGKSGGRVSNSKGGYRN